MVTKEKTLISETYNRNGLTLKNPMVIESMILSDENTDLRSFEIPFISISDLENKLKIHTSLDELDYKHSIRYRDYLTLK